LAARDTVSEALVDRPKLLAGLGADPVAHTNRLTVEKEPKSRPSARILIAGI